MPPDDEKLWARDEDEHDLISQRWADTRVPEPKILDVVKAFDLQAYLNNGFSYYKSHPQQLKTELLSGITLALIEVPEAIVFAFMAGLDPYYGLASVFWIGTLTGLFGGRPAMVSGAAGAMAVVMGDLTRDDGPLKTFPRQARVEQLLMTVVLIGILEVFCAPLLCAFVKIIPSSAMIGFMNALAIILVKGQVDAFKICTSADTFFNDCAAENKVFMQLDQGETWAMLGLVALTLGLMWALPKLKRIGKVVPASLVAIVVGTAVEWGINRPLFHARTRTVGETAQLGSGLPGFHFPDLPRNPAWGTIVTYAISLCLVGGVETVMTHEVVNSLVKDPPDSFASKQELLVQGVANLLTGMFGGMGGSALIGETVISVLHGARGRVSCVTTGLTMLCIMEGLSSVVALMPIAALAGVIFSVSLHTFQWRNLRQLHKLPRHDAMVIVLVTALSVATNLAIGIAVGVAFASILHVWRTGMALTAHAALGIGPQGNEPRKVYHVTSPLFFGSTRPLLRIFGYSNDPFDVVVDLKDSGGILDLSGITSLNEVGKSYEELDKRVTVVGLDATSLEMLLRYPDVASHLYIPALEKGKKETDVTGAAAAAEAEEAEKRAKAARCLQPTESLTLGPEGIELGLEMGIDEEAAHHHRSSHHHQKQQPSHTQRVPVEVVAEEKGTEEESGQL